MLAVLAVQQHLCMAILAGQMEWSGILAIAGVDVGTVTDEQIDEHRVSVQCCHVQWRETICTAAVDSQTVQLQDT